MSVRGMGVNVSASMIPEDAIGIMDRGFASGKSYPSNWYSHS
jgi:hypothetical protein